MRVMSIILLFSSALVLTTQLAKSDEFCSIVTCGCEPKRGEVDACLLYWVYRNNPATGPERIINEDPAACSSAVEGNLSELTQYYSRRPQISVPNEKMIELARLLVVPPSAPLFSNIGLIDTKPDNNGATLSERIAGALQRSGMLLKPARDFATTRAETRAWEAAGHALAELIVKIDGVGKALLVGKQWPELTELAPQIWELEICKYINRDLVVRLSQRLDPDDPDNSWAFTFYGDWLDFAKSFHIKPVSAVPADFSQLALPFFAEPENIVDERKDKTLYTAATVREFEDVLRQKRVELVRYIEERNAQQTVQLQSLRSVFEVEKAVISDLYAAVHVERNVADHLKDTAEAVEREKSEVNRDLARVRADVSAATGSLKDLTGRRDVERLKAVQSNDDLRSDRESVQKVQEALSSVELLCNGVPYKECGDTAAKLDYDRRLYEVNLALADARETYAWSLQQMVIVVDRLLAAENAIEKQQAALSDMRDTVGNLVKKVEQVTGTAKQSEVESAKKAAEVAGLVNQMAGVNRVAGELASLLNG